jgi:hypothetical protein
VRGDVYGATACDGVGDEKDRAQARAVLAVSRYSLGVPGPAATQGEQREPVGACAYKVFEQMERAAAQGARLLHDATACTTPQQGVSYRCSKNTATSLPRPRPSARPRVRLGVDDAPATSGEGNHRWRRPRCHGAFINPLLTGLAQWFVDQTGEQRGFFGALASGRVRGEGDIGRVPGIVRVPEMDEEADEDKSSQE